MYKNIKNWKNYIKEDSDNELDSITTDDDKYEEFKTQIKEMIESTIENNGGNFQDFVESFNKSPEDYKIEGFINDSDIYEFYLKNRNDVDEILNNINFFDEVPTDNNSYGLYEYTIIGTQRAVQETIKDF